jgi:hypothetical protein
VSAGVGWLLERIAADESRHPSPTGFHVAKLWYCERLSLIIFTVAALGRAKDYLA